MWKRFSLYRHFKFRPSKIVMGFALFIKIFVLREFKKTEGVMSRALAVHVCDKSLYISLPSSAKQQREMTKF